MLAALLSFWVDYDRRSRERCDRVGLGGAAVIAAVDAIEQDAHSRWYFLVAGACSARFDSGVGARPARRTRGGLGLPPTPVRRASRARWLFTAGMVTLVVVSALTAVVREQAPDPDWR